jgi:peroxiredoxin
MGFSQEENGDKMGQLNFIDSLLEKLGASPDPDIKLVYSGLKDKRNRLVSLDNSPAPLFTLPDTNKKMYSLADFKGKVVLLDFWDPGCVPCMHAIPNSNKLQDNMAAKDFKMLGICFSGGGDYLCKMILQKYQWKGTHLLASSEAHLMDRYVFDGFPHYVLIDKKGIIRNSGLNLTDLDAMEKEIGLLLAE